MAEHKSELRQTCPDSTLNVLDAQSEHRDITRTDLVNEILGKWAEVKVHEAMLIMKAVGVYPKTSDK